VRKILAQFMQREAHPVIQFIKYGIAGAAATAVDILIFYFLAWRLLPALTSDDFMVRLLGITPVGIGEAVRSRNFVIDSGIAFIFSNLTAYLINIFWVFESGRHKRHVEIALFYLVSVTSIVVGTLLGWSLIRFWGITTSASYLAKMVAAVLINYVCRKFLVFKG